MAASVLWRRCHAKLRSIALPFTAHDGERFVGPHAAAHGRPAPQHRNRCSTPPRSCSSERPRSTSRRRRISSRASSSSRPPKRAVLLTIVEAGGVAEKARKTSIYRGKCDASRHISAGIFTKTDTKRQADPRQGSWPPFPRRSGAERRPRLLGSTFTAAAQQAGATRPAKIGLQRTAWRFYPIELVSILPIFRKGDFRN